MCCSNVIKRCRSVCTGECVSAGVGHSLSRTPQKIYGDDRRKDHAGCIAPRQSAYEHACSVHSSATNDHFPSRSSSGDLTLRPISVFDGEQVIGFDSIMIPEISAARIIREGV